MFGVECGFTLKFALSKRTILTLVLKHPPCSNVAALQPIRRRHLGSRVSQFANAVLLRRPPGPPAPPPAPASVPGLGVELLADVVDDFGNKLVEVVELVHEEGVVLVGVRGDVLQLILGRPGDADGVGDHTWGGGSQGGTADVCVHLTSNTRTMHEGSTFLNDRILILQLKVFFLLLSCIYYFI